MKAFAAIVVIIHSDLFISAPILPSFQSREVRLSQSQPLHLCLFICLFVHNSFIHSFIHSVFIAHPLGGRHCTRHWGITVPLPLNASLSSFLGDFCPYITPFPIINPPSLSCWFIPIQPITMPKSFLSSFTRFFLSP